NSKKECEAESNATRFQDALKRVAGQAASIRFEVDPSPSAKPIGGSQVVVAAAPTERKRSLNSLPMFKKASEALGAQIWHVDDEFDPTALPKTAAQKKGDDESDTDEE
ncbi:MAG TPA: hypothetical protein VGE74_07355, partial [Gemmata sp.]